MGTWITRCWVAVVVALLAAVLANVVDAAPVAAADGAPSPTPARTGAPNWVVVLGDSISAGTGSPPSGAIPGVEYKEYSWATGTASGLNSYYHRLLAQHGGSGVNRTNLAANGHDMASDIYNQAVQVPAGAGIVLIQMGGNDLCKNTEAQMTTPDVYRRELRRALDWLQANRPETLVFIGSIPDIYALWYVRGAPHTGEQFGGVAAPGPRTARDSAENSNKDSARFFWTQGLFQFPCLSLLTNPTVPRNAGPTPDPTHPDEARRLRVRARNIELNHVIDEECGRMLRCRFDDYATFDLVSNRDENGVLLADKSKWTFVDADISTTDHFHPSFNGQKKLAQGAWDLGYDWDDVTPPMVSMRTTGWGAAPGTVDVRIDASDAGGVRGFEYRVHTAGAPATAWTSVVGTSATTVAPASAGTYVEARALDVNGNLSASSVQGLTEPGAPQAVQATPGPNSAHVSWSPPVDDGGVPVTGYRVTASPGGKTCETSAVPPAAPATTCQVTGLANGTAHSFTVTATNTVGTGSASSASNPVTPANLPGAPGTPTATPADASVQLTWTAASSGGSPITGYTATATPGGATCTTTGTLGCTVGGLTNGLGYRFSVTATNAVGTGPASALSSAVTPRGAPLPPRNVVATAGDGMATVSWTSPTSNGGSPITSYTATASPGGATCEKLGATSPHSCVVTGLSNGTPYTFTVTATNGIGTGQSSEPSVAVTPAVRPTPPRDVVATPGAGSATVSWAPPESDGGAPVTGYTVTSTPGGATCTRAAPPLTCVVTGLANGTPHTFTVTATNRAGTSEPSDPSSPVAPRTTPGAPGSVSASFASGVATVTWQPPTTNGGAPVTAYTATAAPGGASCTTDGALTCSISGLTAGQTYTLSVVATNAAGPGPAGSTTLSTGAPPAAPTLVSATPGDARALLTWSPPTSTGGLAVSQYQARCQPSVTGPAIVSTKTTSTTATLSGLVNGVRYGCRVRATNSAGTGPWSAALNVTPRTTPSAPLNLVGTAGTRSAKLNWQAPASNGGAPITSYDARCRSGTGHTGTASTTLRSVTVTGLTSRVAYDCQVRARNAAGAGTWSGKVRVRPT